MQNRKFLGRRYILDISGKTELSRGRSGIRRTSFVRIFHLRDGIFSSCARAIRPECGLKRPCTRRVRTREVRVRHGRAPSSQLFQSCSKFLVRSSSRAREQAILRRVPFRFINNTPAKTGGSGRTGIFCKTGSNHHRTFSPGSSGRNNNLGGTEIIIPFALSDPLRTRECAGRAGLLQKRPRPCRPLPGMSAAM